MASQPTVFFNVLFTMNPLPPERSPFPVLLVDNCFFINRSGEYVSLEALRELFWYGPGFDILIVRCDRQVDCVIPDLANFDNYPEFWDPTKPNGREIQYINENEPHRIMYPFKSNPRFCSANISISHPPGYISPQRSSLSSASTYDDSDDDDSDDESPFVPFRGPSISPPTSSSSSSMAMGLIGDSPSSSDFSSSDSSSSDSSSSSSDSSSSSLSTTTSSSPLPLRIPLSSSSGTPPSGLHTFRRRIGPRSPSTPPPGPGPIPYTFRRRRISPPPLYSPHSPSTPTDLRGPRSGPIVLNYYTFISSVGTRLTMTSEREPIVGNENKKLFRDFEQFMGKKLQVPQIIKRNEHRYDVYYAYRLPGSERYPTEYDGIIKARGYKKTKVKKLNKKVGKNTKRKGNNNATRKGNKK